MKLLEGSGFCWEMTKLAEATDSLWRLPRTRLRAQPIKACIQKGFKKNPRPKKSQKNKSRVLEPFRLFRGPPP